MKWKPTKLDTCKGTGCSTGNMNQVKAIFTFVVVRVAADDNNGGGGKEGGRDRKSRIPQLGMSVRFVTLSLIICRVFVLVGVCMQY